MTLSHERCELWNSSAPRESPLGVLVVDDEPVVLCLLKMFLPRMGFTVWTADSGQAALSLYEQLGKQIDLVLLDVRMPVLDGPQTLGELRRFDPDVKCCFMSGYTGQYTPDSLQQLGALAVFDKPFDLACRVRSVMLRQAHERGWQVPREASNSC